VMTIIETAKRNGLDVYGYLLHLLTELPKYGHTPTREQLEALMPWSDSLPDFCKKKYSQVESVTIPEMSLCIAKV
ncbi:transposase domain-containing protein, partial [Ruminococcus sp.]|uniref:transposase domain-containing protein n=1 Tax=Ruminococcus sp. TaxID=41978 RepID=UPI00258AE920